MQIPLIPLRAKPTPQIVLTIFLRHPTTPGTIETNLQATPLATTTQDHHPACFSHHHNLKIIRHGAASSAISISNISSSSSKLGYPGGKLLPRRLYMRE